MTHVDLLLERFRKKGLLIDANLLVLSIVGALDIALVGENGFKRIRQYTTEDFELLGKFASQFQRIVTTPHVLTEVSNLMGQLDGNRKQGCFQNLKAFIAQVEEIPVKSSDAANRTEFVYLGLTDCALAQLANEFLILTDDARCVKRLNEAGLDALNFTNLRAFNFR